jgi:hypothetical protein
MVVVDGVFLESELLRQFLVAHLIPKLFKVSKLIVDRGVWADELVGALRVQLGFLQASSELPGTFVCQSNTK